MTRYIIVGDTEQYKECLIYAIMGDLELAEQTLHRMLNNPDEHDIRNLKRFSNIKIKAIAKEDAWWDY